jgi:hypothetical protein
MAVQDSTLTQEYLQSLFDYRDGELYWKNHKYKGLNGKIAGTLKPNGYKQVLINKRAYQAHRIIFLMLNGYLPKLIDHKDTNPSNNKIENLRPATNSENSKNCKIFKTNKSGFKNIYWNKRNKKWQVYISVDKKQKYFGQYFDIEVAKFVAETMRYKYYGAFANEGLK